ncbi:MAG TPA: PDZ domain-containing protein [Pyrinomonadaceae bacterium]
MPDGLRFCRKCGFRLGEGVEEYTATRRFDAPPATAPAATATTTNLNGAGAAFNMPGTWGAVAPVSAASMQGQTDSKFMKLASSCNPLRLNWIVWILVLTAVLTAGTLVVQKMTRSGRFAPPPPAVSFVGVDGFSTADGGGAFIDGIAGVGSPVERAGLIGGDIITSINGQKIEDADDASRIIRATPPGQTIEVVYIRDGATATTQLTTITKKEFAGLEPLEARPGGQGRIGVDVGSRKRVPTLNTYGVELDDVDRNGPADLAGLKEGDIVIQFNEHLVRTAGDLRYRIWAAVPGSTAEVIVMRGSERVAVPVKVGRSKD